MSELVNLPDRADPNDTLRIHPAESHERDLASFGSDSAPATAAELVFDWRCPLCDADLDVGDDRASCETCGTTYPRESGIWRLLPRERALAFAGFLEQYRAVRSAEGWGGQGAGYYRSLPYVATGDQQADIWRMRAASFHTLIARVIVPLERRWGRPLTVLDLGAGNGWLAYQLARRGHVVAAVDLSDDPFDGLGAQTWYPRTREAPRLPPFVPVQAEFDQLPFAEGQADLAIFSGALHYSRDVRETLREAWRILRSSGLLVVLDSPVYRDAASGAQMVREREERFERTYGFRSDRLGSEGFLTEEMLASLETDLLGHWRYLTPGYGWRRAVAPWTARVRRRREPASFPVIVGERHVTLGDQPKPPDLALSHTIRAPAHAGSEPSHPSLVVHLDWAATAVHPPSISRVNPGRRPEPPNGFFRNLADLASRRVVGRSVVRAVLYWRFRLFERHRYNRLVLEQVAGQAFLVLPDVFNPKLFRTGAFLAETLDNQLIPRGASVLDLGTGSGVGAVAAAKWTERVVAVDVNPAATRCARINALLASVEDRIDVREGDLFTPVADDRFDVILFNPPFFRGVPREPLDHAWRSIDVVERFAAELDRHLSPGGRALVVLSTDGEAASFLATFAAHRLSVETVSERNLINETLTMYSVWPEQ